MERIVEINPAFDRRDPDPSKNYGIHGAEIRMLLKGSEGATQFVLYTNRHLPHVVEETINRLLVNHEFTDGELSRIREYSGEFPVPGKELETVIEWAKFVKGLGLGYDDAILKPMAADLGYHSRVRRYEGQLPQRRMIESAKFENGEIVSPISWGENVYCKYTDGDCYYDGSSLNAERVWEDVLIASNPDIIWLELESSYNACLIEDNDENE